MGNQQEIQQGNRFEFGKNWNSFLKILDDKRIEVAVESLKQMLEGECNQPEKEKAIENVYASKWAATVCGHSYGDRHAL
jgi:hypothetical protein